MHILPAKKLSKTDVSVCRMFLGEVQKKMQISIHDSDDLRYMSGDEDS